LLDWAYREHIPVAMQAVMLSKKNKEEWKRRRKDEG